MNSLKSYDFKIYCQNFINNFFLYMRFSNYMRKYIYIFIPIKLKIKIKLLSRLKFR